MTVEHQVRDLSLAEAGRHQIRLAEHEMPGLMSLLNTLVRVRCREPRSPAPCT